VVEQRSYTAHVGGSIPPRPTVFTEFTISSADAGQRLDVFCVAHAPGASRAAIQRAIKNGDIQVNQETVKPRQIVREGDVVSITLPEAAEAQAAEVAIPECPIIYEDRDVVVIDKPAGLAVHPGAGQPQATVAAWFAARYLDSVSVGDPDRPGIVHRLDKDTSGVLILAKTQKAYDHLKSQFERRRAHKDYLALVFGVPGEPKGRINRALLRSKHNPLRRTIDPAGKEAVTEWRLEEKFARHALLRVWPLTGRMHQIRVHLHFLGFPIVGDALYVFKRQKPPHGVRRQLLHAEKLTLMMPSGDHKTFIAPLPADFQNVLKQLRK
jgi:23S rRNA pseudouridine1911/1915/1917 synthase